MDSATVKKNVMETVNHFNALVDLPSAELYKKMAISDGKAAVLPDLERRGKEIYSAIYSRLREPICKNNQIRTMSNAAQERQCIQMHAALADCISGFITGIAAATFIVLLLREGLPKLCSEYWSGENSDEIK